MSLWFLWYHHLCAHWGFAQSVLIIQIILRMFIYIWIGAIFIGMHKKQQNRWIEESAKEKEQKKGEEKKTFGFLMLYKNKNKLLCLLYWIYIWIVLAACMWSHKRKDMEKLAFSQIRKPPPTIIMFNFECMFIALSMCT